jgi:hypothetical protein
MCDTNTDFTGGMKIFNDVQRPIAIPMNIADNLLGLRLFIRC